MIPTDFPWTGAARQLSARVHELALRSLCRRYVFVFLLAGGRHSAALSGQPAAAPMAIFELLDYIVIEVCAFINFAMPSTPLPPGATLSNALNPHVSVYDDGLGLLLLLGIK